MNVIDHKNQTCTISELFKKESDKWYSRRYIRFLLLPYMYSREISYSKNPTDTNEFIHCKKRTVSSEAFLESLIMTDSSTILELFSSLGKYDFNGLLEKGVTVKQKGKFFEENEPYEYSLAFDVDGDGETVEDKIKDTYRNTHKLALILASQNVKSYISFSGGKGFHIDTDETFSTLEEMRDFAINISDNLPIDTAIYTKRREWRVPYSIHAGTGYVVYPLSSKQFHCLGEKPKRVNELTPSNLIRSGLVLDDLNKLYNRGLKGFTYK